MNRKFDIALKEYKIILDILKKYLKIPAKIWIFGSRAKHKTKRNSDLDIAIESTEAISVGILADLQEAFTDAPLPYTVDIVELNRVKTEFQTIINQHKVLLTIIGNIPKLRFPEFEDAGEWEEKRLEQVVIFLKGKGIAKSDVVPNGSVPCIRYGELYTDYQESITKVKSFVNLDPSNLVLSRINDVIIPASGETEEDIATASCVLQKDIALGGDINIIRSRIDGVFFSYYLNSAKRKDIAKLAQGISIVHLYPSQLKKLIISIPKKSEQQKIADCLTALDDLISAATGQLDALKQHKQGLMQQLFPAEGETVPRLRFAEFRDAGEWATVPLEELYSFKATNSFSRGQLNYEIGEVKNIHYGDIHTKFSASFNIKEESVPFINPTESLEKIKYDCYCEEGDMIFADASEDLNDVGKSIEIVSLNNEKLLSGLHTLLVRQKKSRLVIGFGGYLFKSSRIRAQIKREAQGAKVLGISAVRISRIDIAFPINKKEQQKIVACLASLDDLIAAQTQKIAKLKTHKRGLMQQLFPAVDETHR